MEPGKGPPATEVLDGAPPVDRHVHGPPVRRRPAPPRPAGAWATVSVLLAFRGIAVVAVGPQARRRCKPFRLIVRLPLRPAPPRTVLPPAPVESPPPVAPGSAGDGPDAPPLPASRPV